MEEKELKLSPIKEIGTDEMKKLCPAIFAVKPAPGVSKKYQFVPTIDVINDIKSMGWIPVEVASVKSRSKAIGKGKHMIKFEHPDFETKDNERIQILLINSHDGSTNFQLSIGVFRLVCSNGLVVKDNDMGEVKVRHLGYSKEDIQEAVHTLVEGIPTVFLKMEQMKETKLTEEQMGELALKSACIRFNKDFEKESEELSKILDIEDLLDVERRADQGNGLYEVFNRVQEKLINGGFEYVNVRTGVPRKARKIKNFQQNNRVNQELWEVAQSYIQEAEMVS